VCTGLDYVPTPRRPEFLARLLNRLWARGGRLVVGVFDEETRHDGLEQHVAALGHWIAGRTCAAHRHLALSYKAFWVDLDPSPR
jgi:hypothetical protein